MEKKIKKIIIASILVSLFLVPTVNADIEYASTEDDPLVTLSYINFIKEQLKTEILTEVSKTQSSSDTQQTSEAAAGYEVVKVASGQKLMAASACELILRSGSAEAVVTGEYNIAQSIGLSDVTSSEEITNGAAISKNHYLIIPRADGRGVKVTSEEGICYDQR